MKEGPETATPNKIIPKKLKTIPNNIYSQDFQ